MVDKEVSRNVTVYLSNLLPHCIRTPKDPPPT